MNILIPMSGIGSRFLRAGYKEIKPLVKILKTIRYILLKIQDV